MQSLLLSMTIVVPDFYCGYLIGPFYAGPNLTPALIPPLANFRLTPLRAANNTPARMEQLLFICYLSLVLVSLCLSFIFLFVLPLKRYIIKSHSQFINFLTISLPLTGNFGSIFGKKLKKRKKNNAAFW